MGNLADYFTADGWLELHGCNVAEGVEGKLYLSRLASDAAEAAERVEVLPVRPGG